LARVFSRRLSLGSPPPAAGEGADVDEEGEDDEEPLEADDAVRPPAPHQREGERRPGQQEEAQQREDPAVEGAAEQIAEQPQGEQRQPRRDQREEQSEATDGERLSAKRLWSVSEELTGIDYEFPHSDVGNVKEA
jgi:hypothetical protein